jgi:hypothetical protein
VSAENVPFASVFAPIRLAQLEARFTGGLVAIGGIILPGLKHLVKLHHQRRGDELLTVQRGRFRIRAGARSQKGNGGLHVDQT